MNNKISSGETTESKEDKHLIPLVNHAQADALRREFDHFVFKIGTGLHGKAPVAETKKTYSEAVNLLAVKQSDQEVPKQD